MTCGWKAFRVVLWIGRPLAANAAQFVVHPVVHVEDELSDGVGKTFHVACSEFCRKILDAGQRISMSTFAVQQFSQCA